MSQATRALVERLKREVAHLPSNTPQQNIALATIAELFDQCVEPEEVEEAPEASVSAAEAAVDAGGSEDAEAAQESAGGGEGDAGVGPMTTGNAPT